MDLAMLTRLVESEIRARAAQLDLDRDALEVRFVFNWGGFTNQSFSVHDGHRRYHLKLAHEAAHQSKLRRWHAARTLIEAHYLAPEIVDWIEIPGSAHQGLLFRHVEGHAPDAWTRELRLELGTLLRRLHADARLRRLVDADGPGTCAQAYLADFHERFTEDLAFVATRPPDFVTPELLAWTSREVARLAAEVIASPAFAAPATSVIHGDLWLGNILMTADSRWFLLDWDELRLGDPMQDVARLAYPASTPDDPAIPDEVAALADDDAARARLDLLGRAVTLDWILDPLADHVAVVDEAPDHVEAMRARSEREHRRALAHYRERYS